MSDKDIPPNNYKPWKWWFNFAFIGIAALLTIVFFIYEHPRLAFATIAAGICACITFQILRCHFHFKKISEYVTHCHRAACIAATEDAREKVIAAEKKSEELLAAAEKRAEESIENVEKKAEEKIIAAPKEAEEKIVAAEKKAEKQIEVREAALIALHELTITCINQDNFVNTKYDELYNIISEENFVTSIYGAGKDFLYHVTEHIVNVFRPLVLSEKKGKSVRLWTAIRHLNEEKTAYITIMRSSEHNPRRKEDSTDIPVDQGIPKLVKDQYGRDKKGVIIASPKTRGHYPQKNDKLGENESMLATPVVIGTEIPAIVVLNSNIPNLFDEHLAPYMLCCAGTYTMALKNMLKSLK